VQKLPHRVPRNPLVAVVLFKKAGAHGKTEKAKRREEKMKVRKLACHEKIKHPVASHVVFAGRLALNAVKPNIIRQHALGFGLRPQHQPTKPLRRKRRGIKPEEIKKFISIAAGN